MADFRPYNVLAEANANLERTELPSVDGTDKQKFPSSLQRSVPNDDRPGRMRVVVARHFNNPNHHHRHPPPDHQHHNHLDPHPHHRKYPFLS